MSATIEASADEMNETAGKTRFIPYRKTDVIEMCVRDGGLDADEQRSFRELCRVLQSIFHFEFHDRLEDLKDAYDSFDPDSDTRSIRELEPGEKAEVHRVFVERLQSVLEAGNYERIEQDELDRALIEESLFRIRLHVDFGDFEEIILFCRGKKTRREVLRKFFGLRKEEISVEFHDRVAIYVRFKEQEYFDRKERKDILFKPGSTLLKLFRNVPRRDLEMLFPNTEVRMKPFDKVAIGVPALVGSIAVVVTKLGATLVLLTSLVLFWLGLTERDPDIGRENLIAFAVGTAGLGAYLVRQWTKFKNRKIRFMKALTDNLYFKNLDNNLGVICRLIDDAEEEECKEAILAYYFLLTEARDLDCARLDALIEEWFETRWDCGLDFEVEDALRKLERLGLVRSADGALKALPLLEAKRRLDKTWDGYFDFEGRQAGKPVS